jgi:DNA ligase 1
VKYSKLAEIYQELEKNSSRLKKTEILSKFFKTLNKNKEDNQIIYLIQGTVWPDYIEKEFGISNQLSIKALSKTTGTSTQEIIKQLKKIGDLGLVTEKLVNKKSQSTLFTHNLTTKKVIENLQRLPEIQGKGAIDRKMSIVAELLTSASGLEAKYIIRTLLNDLRIGVASGTLRDSIHESFFKKQDKETLDLIQSAYDKSTDLALVFEKASKGKKALSSIKLHPGKPIKVMLALKAENIDDGFKKVGKPAVFEYKYDGFRMLINKNETGEIKIFTRRLDEVTKQFPEVVDYIKKHVKAKSFILDSEAVGYNPKTKKYTDFQYISQRIRRKHNIESLIKKLPVEINVFDILYHNGKALIDEPFKKRSELLRKILKSQKYKLVTAKQLITSDEKKAQKFYEEALKANEEGVMIKSLLSPYKPGSRVGHMLKLKPNEKELDLVIIGAEYGKGKRAGWLSSFDLACLNQKTQKYVGLGKVGTGIKEKSELGVSFEQLTKLLLPLKISEKDKHIVVKPKIIVTITYQNIQRSPSYPSGFALRFPRLTVLRDPKDKSLKDIATLKDLETDYNRLNEWRRPA